MEELAAERKRAIINQFLKKMMQQDSSLYYASTAEVARVIDRQIKESKNKMDVEDQALMRQVTARDIEIILSLKK